MERKSLLDRLLCIDAALSPENLWRDGEATPAEANGRKKTLEIQRKEVIKLLGGEPTQQELYGV